MITPRAKEIHTCFHTLELPLVLFDIVYAYQKTALFVTFESELIPDRPFDPCSLVFSHGFIYLLPNKNIPSNIYDLQENKLNLRSSFQLNIKTKQQNESLKSFEITDRFIYYLYERSLIIQKKTDNQLLVNRILSDSFGAINTACDFKVDGNQMVYWTILAKHKIYYMNLQNVNRIETFGDSQGGQKSDQFYDPFGVTCDKNNLYVCDHGNNRVKVLNKHTGQPMYHFGGFGKYKCTRILLHEDIIVVCEWYHLLFFDKISGTCLFRMGKKGETSKEFDRIRGMCIVEDRLLVVDSTCRIQVFS